MRLYRVHFCDSVYGSHGFAWFSSRDAAERSANKYVRDNAPEPETGDAQADMYRRRSEVEKPDIEEVVFDLTKRSVLALLEDYATHPNNG